MKILVLGPVASGKTTLAKQVHERYHLPLFELDSIVHDDINHEKRPVKEQRSMINEIIRSHKEWILEGMPRDYLDVLASNATMIIYLDYSKKQLLRRLRIRHLKYKLKITKVPFETNRDLYLRMKSYIENDHKENLVECMKKYPTKLIIVKNKREIQKLFLAIEEGQILKYQ